MLINSKTGKEIKLPKIHGNKKIKDPITGTIRTYADWKRAGEEAAENLIKALNDPTGLTPI